MELFLLYVTMAERERKSRKFTHITEIIEEIRRGRKVKQVAKEFCVGQTQVH